MLSADEVRQIVEQKFGSGARCEVVDPLTHVENEVLVTAKVGGLGFKDKTGQNTKGIKWEDFDFGFANVSDSKPRGPATKEYILAKHLATGKTIDTPCEEVLRDGGEAYGTTLLQLPDQSTSDD